MTGTRRGTPAAMAPRLRPLRGASGPAVRRWRRAIAACAALCLAGSVAATAAGAEAPGCRVTAFEGVDYTVCTARAGRDDLRLWHSDAEGRLYGGFAPLDRALAQEGRRLLFAMNGGMYHDDRAPVGHYVEDGREMAPLVTSDGPGNFGLLPNGVFCLTARRAAVIETGVFAARRPECRFATQSGPLLVIDGRLHPRFLPRSDSRHVRNGVGVAADGVTVHLAISGEPVNFHTFGRFFRDGLGTPDALYLDGKVSRLWAPRIGRADPGFPIGPILGVAVPR